MQRQEIDHRHLFHPGPLRATGARGFTLIELMVVVVIIGIVVAGAILSMGATGRDSQLEQERDRLTALIAYVRERGALLTLEYGIRCGQHGYRFVYYDNRLMQWLPETLDDTLRARHLPNGLNLHLVVEGREIVLDDKALQLPPNATGAPSATALTGLAAGTPSPSPLSSSSTTNPNSSLGSSSSDLTAHVDSNAPQILLMSDGDMNSFDLTLARQSARRSVTVKSVNDGTVSASEIAEAPP
jgi:type II secretion system protein H